MEHRGTQRIETERLVLRRFEMADTEAMWANWVHDPEVTRFLTWQPHAHIEETRALTARWVTEYANPSFYQWAIVPKDRDEPIGSISGVRIDPDIEQVEVGYCIGHAWWGRGYTTEALQAAMAFFFDKVGFRRVQACHDPDNSASGAVMRKAGLRYEGTIRGGQRNNLGIRDKCVWGLLATDR